jgi:Icc-related predicted phosphoesterase
MIPGEVLVLHFPVKGHLDQVARGENTGSESALRIVEKYKPALVISGHIHETRGVETDENGVLYVNPGPIKDGYAALVNIDRGQDKRYDIDIQLLP